MNLPDLQFQFFYGRVAWAVVMAAAAIGALSLWRVPARPAIAFAALVSVALQALPGAAAPGHWLTLAFQWPSPLLVALCAIGLVGRWQSRDDLVALPRALALAVAGIGAVLYLDSSGWTALELYFAGFDSMASPLAALLLGSACVVAMARGFHPWHASALMVATTAYMVGRLPTGNLWDALLDPLLWAWALVALVRAAVRGLSDSPRGLGARPGVRPWLVAASLVAAVSSSYLVMD